MSETALLFELTALELELHHPGAPCSTERLEQLLHPQFHEVGRSGRPYDRQTVIRFLATHPHNPTESGEFRVERLAEACALLTYSSRHRETGDCALRSSIWLQTAAGWQLYYHQGTPTQSGT